MRPVLAVLVLCACSTTIDFKYYKRTCSTDADCVAVYSGDVCALCPCPNEAIASSELTRYQSDSTSLHGRCHSTAQADCVPCATVTAFCLGGTCSVHAQ